MVTLLDIAWAAGFLDGEGSFVCKSTSNGLTVSAPQKARELLDKLVGMFGGHIYERPNIFQWQLGGTNAAGVMMTLYPFMSSKRKGEIKKSLEGWKSVPLAPNKHISLFGKCRKGHEWIEENVIVDKEGDRRCKTCLQNRSRAYSKTYYIAHKETIKSNSKANKLHRKMTMNTIDGGLS